MSILAKAAGIAVIVWFYMSATKHQQPPVKWVLLGVLGYWLAWGLVKLAIVDAVIGLFAKNFVGLFVMNLLPTVCGLGSAYLVRRKLLADIPAE